MKNIAGISRMPHARLIQAQAGFAYGVVPKAGPRLLRLAPETYSGLLPADLHDLQTAVVPAFLGLTRVRPRNEFSKLQMTVDSSSGGSILSSTKTSSRSSSTTTAATTATLYY